MALLSTKTRYALHALAYVADTSRGDPVSSDEILAYLEAYAGGLALSRGYIVKLLRDLSRAGLTRGTYGPGGGYLLGRDPKAIHLIEVIEAMEGPVRSGCCMLSVGDCPMENVCGVQEMIGVAERSFYQTFEQTTLAALVGKIAFPAVPHPAAKARRKQRRAKAEA